MIKRIIQFGIVCVVILAVSGVPSNAQSDNLLRNPGFEAPFVDKGGEIPRQVANGWEAWHVAAAADQPDFENTQPEYYETTNEDRIRSGERAQRYESFFATHTGGVFQIVPDVTVGQDVTFSVYAWVWSSRLDDEDVSEEDGDVILQVGIDPTGGIDGTSDNIVWSEEAEEYDSYNQYTISVTAESETISVWVRSQIGLAVNTTRVYLDDASLTVTGETDADETATPTATSTLVPSPTPGNVTTVPPTVTASAIPTNTPSSGMATSTPAPTQMTDTQAETTQTTYEVTSGDTLFSIAQQFDTSVAALLEANNLDNSAVIFVGQTLTIPTATPAEATDAPLIIEVSPTPGTVGDNTSAYTVQPGDTLTRIARQFGTTAPALAELNGITNTNQISVGQVLRVPSSEVPTATATPQLYTIQPGDSLYQVSLQFNVPLADLIKANNITNANQISIGQQIVIP